MSDPSSCDQPCGQTCSASPSADCAACPVHTPLRLHDVLVRFQREAVEDVCRTARYRMRYFSWGAGPPVVLVHGVGDTRMSFLLLAARLSAHFRCIGYDLPGNPGDGARLWRYRHEHLVEDLFALLDHLGIARSYVLGSSFGSTVALRALHEQPDRLPRAVLQGGMAHRPLRRAERWLSVLARVLPVCADRIPRRDRVLQAVHGGLFPQETPEVWEAFLRWTGQARLATIGWQVRALHRLDLRGLLPGVRQPVLLVHGERDSVVPFAHAEMLHAGLPSAGLAVLEGCGHLPAYTHPDLLAGVVRQFLTPPPAGSDAPAQRHPLPCQDPA